MEHTISIRVLLADDHPLIMAGFAMALANQGVHVVGQAHTAEQAIAMYAELRPDVVVLDVRYGSGATGLDAAKAILRHDSMANIVFFSQFDQDTLIQEAYRLGARAFVTKGCDSEQLAAAIRCAATRKSYFLPAVTERLAQLAIRGDCSPQSQLNPREIQIFKLMAQGLTNAEIAEQLGLSPKTISNASQAVKEKLGVHRTAYLTRLAVKHGLIEP